MSSTLIEHHEMKQKNRTTETVTLASRIAARQTVFSTSVDDDLILFDPDSGEYYGAGIVGQKIWDLITEECTVETVCGELLEEFDVDRQTCESDVLQFLNELHARGLIQTELETSAGS